MVNVRTRVHQFFPLAVMLSVVACCAQPVAESFDLEITLITPWNRDFTMLATVRIGQPFELTATNGAMTNRASGTLHAAVNGAYPLDLTVSERASEASKIIDSGTLNLELGKTSGFGPVSSFVHAHQVTLRRHESHFKPK